MFHKSITTLFDRFAKAYNTELLTFLAQQLTSIAGHGKQDRFVLPSKYEFAPEIRATSLYFLHMLPVDIFDPASNKAFYVHVIYPRYQTVVLEDGSVCSTLDIKQEFKVWFRTGDLIYGINTCHFEYEATTSKGTLYHDSGQKEYVLVKDGIVYVAVPLMLLLVKAELIQNITKTTLDHFIIEYTTGKLTVYAKIDIDALLYKEILGCAVYAYSGNSVFSFYTDTNHYEIYDAYARRFGFLTPDLRQIHILTQNVKGKLDYEHPDILHIKQPILVLEIVHPSMSVSIEQVNLVYLTRGEQITVSMPQQITYIAHIEPDFELTIKVDGKLYRNYNAYWNYRIADSGLSKAVVDAVINNQLLYLLSTSEYVDPK